MFLIILIKNLPCESWWRPVENFLCFQVVDVWSLQEREWWWRLDTGWTSWPTSLWRWRTAPCRSPPWPGSDSYWMLTVSVVAPFGQVWQLESSVNVWSRSRTKDWDDCMHLDGSPEVTTKHHCCCGVRTWYLEQRQQFRDSLLHHPRVLHWPGAERQQPGQAVTRMAGDCQLDIEDQEKSEERIW